MKTAKEYRENAEGAKITLIWMIALLAMFNTALVADIVSKITYGSSYHYKLLSVPFYVDIIGIVVIVCMVGIVASMGAYAWNKVSLQKIEKSKISEVEITKSESV